MLNRILPVLVLMAAALVPMSTHAADAGLTTRVSELGYLLRVAEKCGVDAVELEDISDQLADEIAEDADRSGADRLALGTAVLNAGKRADAEFVERPPQETCGTVLSTLLTQLNRR